MANWRQIQARIRKVKDTPEAATKLGELYAKTRDAMVAFELAAVEERSAHNDEAIKWYTTAHQRFRRQDWKKRVEEALTRLGAALPESQPGDSEAVRSHAGAPNEVFEDEVQISVLGEIHEPGDEDAQPGNESEESESDEGAATTESPAESPADAGEAGKKRRRRGRRGGRGRRRGPGAPALPSERFAPAAGASAGAGATQRSSPRTPAPPRSPAPPRTPPRMPSRPPVAADDYPPAESVPAPRENFAARSRVAETISETPMLLPSERVAHGRGGDPAIASRLAHFESMLRRLLGSQLHSLEESDDAPAGPGVFLIADSDLVTSYYAESCKTLRIALGQLVRGGRGRRESTGPTFKAKLAEHLEITEAKVGDYLKKHCVVRWIQLDDEATHFAHFVIGVLRTPLNDE
jgi:hypothetical protein